MQYDMQYNILADESLLELQRRLNDLEPGWKVHGDLIITPKALIETAQGFRIILMYAIVVKARKANLELIKRHPDMFSDKTKNIEAENEK